MTYDELIDLYRDEDNYLVKENNLNSNICYVFFSSHGLYKENGNAEVLKMVHDSNRFEWLSLFHEKHIFKNCRKAIFVRDLKKVFYIKGINNRIDSIEKLALFLQKETKGMEVYLVGSSAGAYAAFISSNYLKNVKRIYSLGGIIDLNCHSTYKDYVNVNGSSGKIDVIKKINANSLVVHFYGSQNNQDKDDFKLLSKIVSNDKCIGIPLNSDGHAPRPSGKDLVKILTCKESHLLKIKNRLKGKTEIGKYHFSIINIGFFRATINKVRSLL